MPIAKVNILENNHFRLLFQRVLSSKAAISFSRVATRATDSGGWLLNSAISLSISAIKSSNMPYSAIFRDIVVYSELQWSIPYL